MPCTRVTLPGGVTGFVCSRTKPKDRHVPPCRCGVPHTKLCDWKTPDGPSPTCDAPLCESCTTVPAEGKDLCPEHAKEWEARKR